MRVRLTLSRKALILVALPLAFQLVFITILVTLFQRVEEERLEEAHARDVAEHVNVAMRYLLETGTLGVISNLTGSQGYREHYRDVEGNLRKKGLELAALVRDNPTQTLRVNRINELFDLSNKTMDKAYQALSHGDKDLAMTYWLKTQGIAKGLFDTSDSLLNDQEVVQGEKAKALIVARNSVTVTLMLGVIINIILAVLLASYFNSGTTRRLQRLMDNVVLFGTQRKLEPPQEGDDEIAQLGQVFYEMAQALQAAVRKETAVIQNAVDVICSIDPDGRVTAINPAVKRIWDYQPEELVGSRLSLITMPEDLDLTMDSLKRAATQTTPISFENRIRKKDGKYVDMLWSGYWSAEEQSLFCVCHDITERKEIEAMKQDFVAMVSHDLRTPLTSVQGFLSLLALGAYNELSATGKESLVVAEVGVSRLVSLVNDLLDLEKMESGRMQLKRERVSLPELVRDSLDNIEQFAHQQGILLESFVDDNISDIYADQARLAQVIVNLVSNSIKFAPPGSTVSVEAGEVEEFVEVRILDRGRGVEPEMREAIFEKFRQTHLSDERVKGGSGLGLAICKGIVEEHGGKIGVRDSDKKSAQSRQAAVDGWPGSCFWFTIPKFNDEGKVAGGFRSAVS
jgi:PAS domain S-box-containing protein